MVHLTRPAATKLSPVVNHAQDLLSGRGYGRKAIQVREKTRKIVVYDSYIYILYFPGKRCSIY